MELQRLNARQKRGQQSGSSSAHGSPGQSGPAPETPRGVRTAGGRRKDKIVTDDSLLAGEAAYFDGSGVTPMGMANLPGGLEAAVDKARANQAAAAAAAASSSAFSSPARPGQGNEGSSEAGEGGEKVLTAKATSLARRLREEFELPPEDISGLAKLGRGGVVKDSRFVSENELRGFIRQHKDQLDHLDVDSSFFNSLPLEAQYELIQDMRLRSRSTQMDRIENMLAQTKTAKDFSLLQLRGLSRRNELTQKQAELVGGKTIMIKNRSRGKGEGSAYVPRRIAGERDREYVLIKNDDTGIGWSFKLKETPRGLEEGGGTETVIKIKEEVEDEEPTLLREPGSAVPVYDLDDEENEIGGGTVSNAGAIGGLGHLSEDSDDDEEFIEVGNEPDEPLPAKKRGYALAGAAPKGKTVRFQQQPPGRARQVSTVSQAGPLPVAINPAAFVADDESVETVMTRFLELEANGPAAVTSSGSAAPVASSSGPKRQPLQPISLDYEESDNEEWEDVVEEVPVVARPAASSAARPQKGAPSGVKPSETTSAKPSKASSTVEREKFVLPANTAPEIKTFHTTWYSMMPQAVFEEFQTLFPLEAPEESESASSGDDDELQITSFKLKKTVGKEMLRFLTLPAGESGDEELGDALSFARRKLGKMKQEDVDSPKGECLQWWCTFLDAVEDFRTRNARESIPEEPMVVEETEDIQEDHVSARHVEQAPRRLEPVTEPITSEDEIEKRTRQPSLVAEEPIDVDAQEELVVVDDQVSSDEDVIMVDEPATRPNVAPVTPPARKEAPVIIEDEEEEEEMVEMEESALASMAEEEERRMEEQEPHSPVEEPASEEDEAPASPEPAPQVERNDVETNMDEEMAEYAQFVADLSRKDAGHVRQELEHEIRSIRQERGKEQRMSEGVTSAMIAESQELLRLFGLPYIVAPLEAEAQCAKLLQLGLVDGIVTDDSDVFLFGGRLVYRNLFNQNKYVECYLSADLDREMTLDREKLIRLAYLLGSDYTDGIKGVGGVTALEILEAFDNIEFRDGDGLDGLREFAAFWLRAKVNSLTEEDQASALKRRLANLCLKVELPDRFPAPEIREAYIDPTTDDSEESFQWGVPSLDSLRHFLQQKLGWPHEKTDEIVLPIIKQFGSYETEGVQATIDRFFQHEVAPAPTDKFKKLHSNRVQKIVKRWINRKQGNEDEEDDDGGKKKKGGRKRGGGRKKKSGDDDEGADNSSQSSNSESGSGADGKQGSGGARKPKKRAIVVSDSDEQPEPAPGSKNAGYASTSSSSDDEVFGIQQSSTTTTTVSARKKTVARKTKGMEPPKKKVARRSKK